MATRSTIALEYADGTVGQIYCHWDGYLEYNGALLYKHYVDPFKTRELLDLGDLSSLKPEIGEQHAFGYHGTDMDAETYEKLYGDMCTFYGRDRGETGCEYQVSHTFEEFLEQVDSCGAEFYYVMKDGVWYTGAIYEVDGLVAKGLVPLAAALETLQVEG
jgi:hypothetical protein